MFSKEELARMKVELDAARENRNHRAALSAIIRRHIKKFAMSSSRERAVWLMELDCPPSYMTELSKEIAVYNYTQSHNPLS